MNNKTFWEFWVIDSALRGKDPITRFIQGIYGFLWVPFVFFAIVALFTGYNYFAIIAMGLKGIWHFWVMGVWYCVTHFDKVQWVVRKALFPGDMPDDIPW